LKRTLKVGEKDRLMANSSTQKKSTIPVNEGGASQKPRGIRSVGPQAPGWGGRKMGKGGVGKNWISHKGEGILKKNPAAASVSRLEPAPRRTKKKREGKGFKRNADEQEREPGQGKIGVVLRSLCGKVKDSINGGDFSGGIPENSLSRGKKWKTCKKKPYRRTCYKRGQGQKVKEKGDPMIQRRCRSAKSECKKGRFLQKKQESGKQKKKMCKNLKKKEKDDRTPRQERNRARPKERS